MLSMMLCAFGMMGCGADKAAYTSIAQDEAKAMMDEGGVIVLDVRNQLEYDEMHIKDAVLLPLMEINEETASSVIPEKDSVVLVYCWSGSRSKRACDRLTNLGYENIYEFGGIMTWEYDVVMT